MSEQYGAELQPQPATHRAQSHISFYYDTVREVPEGAFSQESRQRLKHMSSIYS